MRLLEFTKRYGDEESCKQLFKEYRERHGLSCRKCHGEAFYWLKTADRWQCKSCGAQIGLRSGTLLESSNLPYHYWIYAMYLMTSIKKGISALELQRQLGHKRYEPIWAMKHKIRTAMGNRDERYKMEGLVELDDGFIKANRPKKGTDMGGNSRGRGTQEKRAVLVMAKFEQGNEKGKKSSSFRYVSMKVMESQGAIEVGNAVKRKATKDNTEIVSDNFRGYSRIKEIVKAHHAQNVPKELAEKVLPWVHTMISNVKRTLLGINHSVDDTYLQNYLNEFCYKVNRRYFKQNLFDRMMVAAVAEPWYGTKY
ncbi:IS1595 family transposase [Galbibacter sp. PAP.153]|uniref:IS1595 family transposase n=1 Tax=Galbibacter sp. PAP.153 TaxID=3104623 RepID=UPI00300996C9